MKKISLQDLKKSERAILVFLNNKKFSTALKISRILEQDKSYINKIINDLIDKGFVGKLNEKKPFEYYLKVDLK